MSTSTFIVFIVGIIAASITYTVGVKDGTIKEYNRIKPTSVWCYTTPDEDGHYIPRGQKSCWQ
jgi:hypothetical protein